jgi:hypothetical protein
MTGDNKGGVVAAAPAYTMQARMLARLLAKTRGIDTEEF